MSVVTNNRYGLLGDDDEGEAEVTTSTKTNARTAAKVEPKSAGGRSKATGNEAAFRDRNAGSTSNRGKSTEEGARGPHRGGYGARVRGGRGSGHPRNKDDRHSKHLPSGSEKQAAQSWGATEGNAELKDEQAGEEMARTEKKEDTEKEGETKESPVEPAEPEEKQTSYADYLAQQAEKKLSLEAEVKLRKANEGTKLDKKWANAHPLVKNDDEVYFEGSGGKAKRERERKTKTLLELDNRFVEPDRGSRGGRGGRGRGRGDTRGRGEYRGRGGPRGGGRGRGGENAPLNPADQSAFPSLGA